MNIDGNLTSELYNGAEEFIKSLGDYCKPTKNAYVLVSSVDATSIRNTLRTMFGDQSCILIVELTGDYSSFNYRNVNEMLNKLL